MTWIAWLRGVLAGPGPEATGMIELHTETDLDAALAASADGPVILFKHSTACPVSHAAHREVAAYAAQPDPLPVYLVKVIERRPVSNTIAERLGVTHQSPQALLVRDGRAAWHASHGGVTAASLRRAAREG